MLPHVVPVEPSADIVQKLRQVYQRLGAMRIYVMSAIGTVANVTISEDDSAVTYFTGIFQILSLSGSYLPHFYSVTMVASYNEQVISGTVEGVLVAIDSVHIIA